jgi:hypothetical protein
MYFVMDYTICNVVTNSLDQLRQHKYCQSDCYGPECKAVYFGKRKIISKNTESFHLVDTDPVHSGSYSVLTLDNIQYTSTKSHGATPRRYHHDNCRETQKTHNR